MDMMNAMMEAVTSQLGSISQSGTVVGEPIQVGNVKIIVLSQVSVGLGAAGGQGGGKAPDGKGSGTGRGQGAGGGAKVRPAAVIGLTPKGVTILPVKDKPGVLDKIAEKIPDVIEMVEKIRASFADGEKRPKGLPGNSGS